METNNVIMWTAQTQIVRDVIEKNGVSYVKKEYIRKKYAETAWIFETAYNYFIKKFELQVEKPVEAESPVWIFKDPKWAGAGQDAQLIKLQIPKDEMVFFDRVKWNRILNLSYVGSDAESTKFDIQMRQQGVNDVFDVFAKPYYPVLKKKIMKSWDGVFEIEGLNDSDMQGAVWCLKKEWLTC